MKSPNLKALAKMAKHKPLPSTRSMMMISGSKVGRMTAHTKRDFTTISTTTYGTLLIPMVMRRAKSLLGRKRGKKMT